MFSILLEPMAIRVIQAGNETIEYRISRIELPNNDFVKGMMYERTSHNNKIR
jgi:hypothetical protein